MIFHSKLKNRISHHVQLEDLPKQTIVHQTRFPQGACKDVYLSHSKEDMYDIGNHKFPQSDYRIEENTKHP